MKAPRWTSASLCAWMLSACFAAAVAEAQVTVGAMAELTGPFAKLGEDCRRGYEIARAVHSPNDRAGAVPVRVVISDNGGDARTGVTEFEKLVSSQHAVAVVTTRSPVGLAISPLSQRKGVPVVGIVAHPKFISDYTTTLRVFPSAEAEGRALAELARSLGKSQIAVITGEDDYFLSLSESFMGTLGQDMIAHNETVLPSEQDFSAVVARLKAKSPDAVLVNVGPAQLASLSKRLRAQGVTAELLTNFLFSAPDVLTAAGAAAEGAMFIESDFRKQRFLDKSRELFGSTESSPVGYSCYVGLAMLLQSIGQLSPTADSKTISSKLQEMERVELLDEQMPLVKREAQFKLLARKIKAGKPEEI